MMVAYFMAVVSFVMKIYLLPALNNHISLDLRLGPWVHKKIYHHYKLQKNNCPLAGLNNRPHHVRKSHTSGALYD